MSEEDVAQLELPWSAEMVEGFRVMVGGTIDAATLACLGTQRPQSTRNQTGLAGLARFAFPPVCHIGGGLHHAFPNHGEGFCPFNDVAVAIRVLQARGIERVAVDRSRCPSRQRHRVHLRVRPARLHLLDASAAQLPGVQAAQHPRHRPAGWGARRHLPARARTRLAGGDGARGPNACSTSRARTRMKTISSAACG